MSFQAKDSTVTFSWTIAPTASPPAKADFDIILILPNGNATYVDDGITTYIAPTATTQGKATYNLTLSVVGLYQVTLSIGTNSVYIVQAHREIFSVIPPPFVLNGTAPNTTQGPAIIPPSPPDLGGELITNPGFDTTDDWVMFGNLLPIISGGVLNFAASSLITSGARMPGLLIVGKFYRVQLDIITSISGDGVVMRTGSGQNSGLLVAVNSYSFDLECKITTDFDIFCTLFVGTVDNVSVKQLLLL